jgi:hypothetical protein
LQFADQAVDGAALMQLKTAIEFMGCCNVDRLNGAVNAIGYFLATPIATVRVATIDSR